MSTLSLIRIAKILCVHIIFLCFTTHGPSVYVCVCLCFCSIGNVRRISVSAWWLLFVFFFFVFYQFSLDFFLITHKQRPERKHDWVCQRWMSLLLLKRLLFSVLFFWNISLPLWLYLNICACACAWFHRSSLFVFSLALSLCLSNISLLHWA